MSKERFEEEKLVNPEGNQEELERADKKAGEVAAELESIDPSELSKAEKEMVKAKLDLVLEGFSFATGAAIALGADWAEQNWGVPKEASLTAGSFVMGVGFRGLWQARNRFMKADNESKLGKDTPKDEPQPRSSVKESKPKPTKRRDDDDGPISFTLAP